MLTMKNLYRGFLITTCGLMVTAFSPGNYASSNDFEAQVEDYIQKFPYQETFDYAMLFTGGDPGKLNRWGQASRELLKAGEDSIVRSNNDTLYKTAFIYLGDGPVVLSSDAPSQERFSSFQLQDDRNANYRNIINPSGSYTLYHGEKPETITGEAVEVPSLLSAVVTRIEVKDKNDAADMTGAQAVFDGITIEGPDDLDAGIQAMIDHPGPVMVDCRVAKLANCFPMIPSGASHTDMILSAADERGEADDDAKALV